jgi:hypothetical protein
MPPPGGLALSTVPRGRVGLVGVEVFGSTALDASVCKGLGTPLAGESALSTFLLEAKGGCGYPFVRRFWCSDHCSWRSPETVKMTLKH